MQRRIGYRAFGGRRHQRAIFAEHTGRIPRRGRLPALHALLQLRCGNVHVEHARVRVDGDRVAFAHRRDRTAVERFRRHVRDHEAVGRAAEAAVGHQRHAVRKSRADDRAGHAEHLAHARSAARTFVADDHDVAGLDLPVASPPPWRPLRVRIRAPGPGAPSCRGRPV